MRHFASFKHHGTIIHTDIVTIDNRVEILLAVCTALIIISGLSLKEVVYANMISKLPR